MGPVVLLEDLLGIALLFVLPGLAVARAVFPERRFRGPSGWRGALELTVLAFVLSVVLTVLVGYLLLNLDPTGFSASWSSPTLEIALAAIAAVAFGVGAFEGSYAAEPRRAPPSPGSGEEGAWAVSEQLERLGTEERKQLARWSVDTGYDETEEALGRTADAQAAVARAREAEYDR